MKNVDIKEVRANIKAIHKNEYYFNKIVFLFAVKYDWSIFLNI